MPDNSIVVNEFKRENKMLTREYLETMKRKLETAILLNEHAPKELPYQKAMLAQCELKLSQLSDANS